MKNAILGVWELVAAEARYDDGVVEQPYGPNPQGLLVYTPEGWMNVYVSSAERPRFASNDMWRGTPEELRAAFQGCSAYFGRYEVDEAARVVIHNVTAALFPNWSGQVQRRHVSLEGEQLVLSTPPMRVGDRGCTAAFVWKRGQRPE